MKAAGEVPVVGEDEWFVAADAARINAMVEVQSAATLEARFEATALATNLWTEQIDHLSASVLDDLREAHENRPADFEEAKVWINGWNDDSARQITAWADFQAELVETLGRDRAQEIADGPVTERMTAVLDSARNALRERLIALGADADALGDADREEAEELDAAAVTPAGQAGMKTCPDCAEEVKAAARKCRYCGYRFDQEPT